MSGSALIYNAYHDGNHKCLMYALAKSASQPANNTKELIVFLKRIPATQIQGFINNTLPALPQPLVFAPVVEGKDAIRPFITDLPARVAQNTQYINLTALITFTDAVSRNGRDCDASNLH